MNRDRRAADHAPRRALLFTSDSSVRAFLLVHLLDRRCQVVLSDRLDDLRTEASFADLLISDLDVLEAAQLEPRRRPAQVLALTPTSMPGDRELAAELGACELIRVPFEDTRRLADLLDAMAEGVAEPRLTPALV